MNDMKSKRAGSFRVVVAIGIAGGLALNAQQPPQVKRNVVLKQDMTIPDREAVMAWWNCLPARRKGDILTPPRSTRSSWKARFARERRQSHGRH